MDSNHSPIVYLLAIYTENYKLSNRISWQRYWVRNYLAMLVKTVKNL